ncbi:MAG: 30S ribosomal protein S6 [Bacteroidales bacterium]|nr:30S ribosomal protein S6 [Bacteroidales bacterium]
MNQYETVFIATPVLSEEQMKETVKKFRSMITENGAEVVYEDDWGLRKLAYPIQHKTTGFYYLIEFKAEGEFIDKFETELRRDERIIRFLTVKIEKYHAIFNEKRRKKQSNTEEKSNKEE